MASRGETTPLSMTMMGGPIDARKSPTAVNNLAMNKSYEWFENNVIYRVPSNFPGAGRRVYPGFLQHTGFVAMNPDRLEGRQISASSSNRNFKGRQGSASGRTLLMSPAMVAAAAIAGKVSDVRQLLPTMPCQ